LEGGLDVGESRSDDTGSFPPAPAPRLSDPGSPQAPSANRPQVSATMIDLLTMCALFYSAVTCLDVA
jgi:hypothetical protein